MARLQYLDASDVPEEYRPLMNPRNPHLHDDESGGSGWDDVEKARNTHRALAHNPEILDAYRRFGAAVWQDTGLSARERELVILSVARTLDSDYEWHQHVRIALTEGIPEDELIALSQGELSEFEPYERTLIEYTEAFVDRTVTDKLHQRLIKHSDQSTLVGVTQLAGYYLSIDHMGDALALDFEEEFIGWELENR